MTIENLRQVFKVYLHQGMDAAFFTRVEKYLEQGAPDETLDPAYTFSLGLLCATSWSNLSSLVTPEEAHRRLLSCHRFFLTEKASYDANCERDEKMRGFDMSKNDYVRSATGEEVTP